MAVPAFYLAGLATAVCWGASPIFSKRGLAYGGNAINLTITALGTGLVMFWAWLAVLRGPTAVLPDIAPRAYAIFFAAGLIGSTIGRIASYTGVERVGASINVAVISTHPIFATVVAFFALGELISALQVAGVVIVVGGLVVLTVSQGGDLSGWSTRDLMIPLLGAMVYGIGSVLRRYGLTTTSAVALEGVALESTTAVIGVLAYALVRHRETITDITPRALVLFVGTGITSSLGLLFLFIGLEEGPVAIVVTLAGTSTLLTTLLSHLLLRDVERVTRRVVVGAALVVGGVALITLA